MTTRSKLTTAPEVTVVIDGADVAEAIADAIESDDDDCAEPGALEVTP